MCVMTLSKTSLLLVHDHVCGELFSGELSVTTVEVSKEISVESIDMGATGCDSGLSIVVLGVAVCGVAAWCTVTWCPIVWKTAALYKALREGVYLLFAKIYSAI